MKRGKRPCAVIDTNVLVSALITNDEKAPTKRIVESILKKKLTPIISAEIVGEYNDVLFRPKFDFDEEVVRNLLIALCSLGEVRLSTTYEQEMPDPKDRIFYEISLTGDNFLVTGNLKHFPSTPKVVTPAQMMDIIDSMYQ